jgi:nicotinamide riboside transporter PnuC
MMNEIVTAFRALSWTEVIAVILGVVYLVLAVKRSRWCWVAGGISSALVI